MYIIIGMYCILGLYSLRRHCLIGIIIPLINPRRLSDRFMLIMVIHITVKRGHVYSVVTILFFDKVMSGYVWYKTCLGYKHQSIIITNN